MLVKNAELGTVRVAMRGLNRMLAALDAGEVERIVLIQRNQMRAVLVSVERSRGGRAKLAALSPPTGGARPQCCGNAGGGGAGSRAVVMILRAQRP